MFSGQLFPQKYHSFRFNMKQPIVVTDMAKKIYSFLPKKTETDIVLVCIGTDRSTGDSLGPLVGTKLLERGCKNFAVYGTLQEPVHAKNLEKTLMKIDATYQEPFIIGVDACLGKSTSVGYMTVSDGPVRPGAAVNKQLPHVGDMHITGIVNVNGFMEMMVLQNTRLSLVIEMADIIARALARSSRWLETNPSWLVDTLEHEQRKEFS
ncbi:putative sporulation protein YyaC [Evansella caseinilytica]|uniref:Putative sporulation protein YyaC n=1 Tax=Evansella caseinilytica TaxID=1503961 RepID=A0A1H3UTL0_9BACI|nr:spore protease YyaC [Evansella caseinilytica]SDZ65175.1 putative sporulation protein YyaC [Evansella caseinilytica]